MAVKFPLEMKNGVMARNISEVRENFDIEKIVSYFLDGKLLTWLEARYYEEEAEAMSALIKDDTQLVKKLHQIFGVEYVEEKEVDTEEIARRNAKIAKLKQYTDDVEIINNVDCVAFDQEELAEIYDKGITKIYLCAGEFVIPKSKRNLEFVEVGACKVEGLEKKETVQNEEIKYELELFGTNISNINNNSVGNILQGDENNESHPIYRLPSFDEYLDCDVSKLSLWEANKAYARASKKKLEHEKERLEENNLHQEKESEQTDGFFDELKDSLKNAFKGKSKKY